jgi:hypothetical protein
MLPDLTGLDGYGRDVIQRQNREHAREGRSR